MSKKFTYHEDNLENIFQEEPETSTVLYTPTQLQVRSRWLSPRRGQVLVECGGDFRLLPVSDWAAAKWFELPQENFLALAKPEAFDVANVSNEALWQAGVVDRSNIQVSEIELALNLSNVSLEFVNPVLNQLRNNNGS